jgi:predicted homoserine dehydrogenase-like protein
VIIVDKALRAREDQGRPIRVGLIGAGFMAQGLANQTVNNVPGMEMAAVYGRRLERAVDAFCYASRKDVVTATTQDDLADAVRVGRPVATDDPSLLCRSEHIDAIVDMTGAVNFGSRVALEAFERGKHVIAMNAEIDATIGPILHTDLFPSAPYLAEMLQFFGERARAGAAIAKLFRYELAADRPTDIIDTAGPLLWRL